MDIKSLRKTFITSRKYMLLIYLYVCVLFLEIACIDPDPGKAPTGDSETTGGGNGGNGSTVEGPSLWGSAKWTQSKW